MLAKRPNQSIFYGCHPIFEFLCFFQFAYYPFFLLGTPIDATFYKEMVDRVKLPSGCWTWTFNSVDNMAYCISCRAAPHGGIVVKTLRIVSTTKANLYVGEKLVTLPSGDGHFENYEQLSGLLAYFHDRNPCRGIVDPSLLDVPVTKACSILQYGNTRRSTSCSFLAERDSLCTSCRKAQRYIKKRLRDGVISSPEEIRLKHRNKLQMKNRLIQRLQAKKKVSWYIRKYSKKITCFFL